MRKLIIIFILLFFQIVYAKSFVEFQYYQGGKDIIVLDPIPKEINYKLKFKGTSKYRNLLFQIIQKNKNKEHQVQLNLKQNDFDYYYLLKDGMGEYNINIFGNDGGLQYKGLCNFKVNSIEEIPKDLKELNINDKIIEYVKSVEGKLVGRGECWDLAAQALNFAKADWRSPLDYGIPLNWEKDEIKPGDIIQMRSVRLTYKNRFEYYGNPDHTSIVYKVLGKKEFIVAQQNASGKRYVTIDKFDLSFMSSGWIQFYRPVAGLIGD